MAEHKARVEWKSDGSDFKSGRYSRAHAWSFDGGVVVPASSSPSVVRPPLSDPSAVDPEEAFVASLSSCHLLTFLYEAARAGFVVARYEDDAVGTMTKNERGVPWVSLVELHPRIEFTGNRLPTDDELEHLHHLAHEGCFIANSVKTEIRVHWTRI